MEKRKVITDQYTWVKYRCDRCRNKFQGIVTKGSGTTRITCSICGSPITIYFVESAV